MVSDTGLIVTSMIGLMGMVLMFIINNGNWFKRENFKLQKSNILAENRIKMKKLERELGLKNVPNPIKSDETGGVLDLVKGLDVNKLLDIADIIKGGGEENVLDIESEPKSEISALIDKLPPSVIEGFLSKLGDNKKGEGGEGAY